MMWPKAPRVESATAVWRAAYWVPPSPRSGTASGSGTAVSTARATASPAAGSAHCSGPDPISTKQDGVSRSVGPWWVRS